MVQDFVGTPALRSFLTSKDNKSWVLPVGLAGELGTPQAYDAYNRVADIVKQTTAGGPLDVHLSGPAATVADLTVAGQRDRLPIEIAIGVLVLAVLLLVYRNPITMLVPLTGIGVSLIIAQSRGRRLLRVQRSGCLQSVHHPAQRDHRRCRNGLRGLPDQPVSRLRAAR